MMDSILEKISSYNIFNYLFPGSVFAVIADRFTTHRFIQDDILVGLFVYYFIGLVISRIGSLLIEPTLRNIKFVTFADYSQFVKASRIDPKVDILSETNNMYRTLCGLFALLLALALFEKCVPLWPGLLEASPYLIGIALFVMFLFAYRKQTSYVSRRVSSVAKDE